MSRRAQHAYLAEVIDTSSGTAILRPLDPSDHSIREVRVPSAVRLAPGDLVVRIASRYITVPYDSDYDCQTFDTSCRNRDNDPAELMAAFVALALIGVQLLQAIIVANEPRDMLVKCANQLSGWIISLWDTLDYELDNKDGDADE